MKRAFGNVLIIAALVYAISMPERVSGEPSNSVNLGIGTSDILPHCRATLSLLEYERVLVPKITALARGSGVHYRFDDGEHVEEGRPRGADVGARYYFSGGMQGLFIGGSLGYWRSDWTFTHYKDTPRQFQGAATSESIRLNVDIGGRYPIGSSPVSIIPALDVGRFFTRTSCEFTSPASLVGTPCSEDSEVREYVFLAVSAGIEF